MVTDRRNRHSTEKIACLVLGLSICTLAVGADLRQAQARYEADRASCLRGESHQDKKTCLQEVSAMLQEAKQGRVPVWDEKAYVNNRTVRCGVLPVVDRDDCLRRMRGEGTTTGSVEAGGIYREIESPVRAAP